MKKSLLLLSLMLINSWHCIVYGAIKGSFTAVSNEPAFTFLSTDTDNTIQGFARFDDGFSLENNVTTCTFNGYFPVSGTVALNGGTLLLEQDLIFRNIAFIESMGNIYGDGHVVDLCQTVTFLSSGSHVLDNVHVRLSADVVLSGTIIIQGTSSIFGDGHALEIAGTGAIIIESGACLELKAITVKGLRNQNVACVDDSARLILHDVVCMQESDFSFSSGSILFKEMVEFIGTATFFYESSQSSTIEHDSEWIMGAGMTLSIGRQDVNSVQPLVFEHASSELHLDNALLVVTARGMQLTRGTLHLTGNDMLDIVSTETTTGLILGNGIASDDCRVFLDAGATLNFNSGFLTYNNATPHGFVSASKESQVVRKEASLLYVARDWIQPSYTLRIVGLVPAPLIETGVTFAFNDTHLIFTIADLEFETTSAQLSGPIIYLSGNNFVDFTQGTNPIPMLISGINNTMTGNGSINTPIIFADSAATLTYGLLGDVSEDMSLNGGTLILSRNLVLNDAATISGSGTINLGFNNIHFSAQESSWTGTLKWNGEQSTMFLNGTLDLSGTWTITGSCIIQGQGNTLDFSQGGKIIVDTDSHLTIRNVRLAGVHGNVIDGIDATAQVVLDNVTWVQNDHAAFTQGSLLFRNTVHMVGPDTVFAYQSNQTSTLEPLSTLYLDHELTFSYDPQNSTDRELFYMTDRSSRLLFDGGKLHVSPVGMHLKRGELRVVSDSTIVVDKPVRDDMGNIIVEEGFTLGDSTVETNDVLFNVDSNAVLHVHGNNFAWRNILASSLRMPGNSLYIQDNSALFIYNVFNEPRGIVSFFNNTVLGEDYDTGAFLQTSVFTFGVLDYVNI
jgi:hypothetical protein